MAQEFTGFYVVLGGVYCLYVFFMYGLNIASGRSSRQLRGKMDLTVYANEWQLNPFGLEAKRI